jgi:hypothetical protein
MERKVLQVLHSTFGYVQDQTLHLEPSLLKFNDGGPFGSTGWWEQPTLTSLGWGTRLCGGMERKVKQVLHSTFGYVQDVAAFCDASGCDRVRRPVRQNRGRCDWALDTRAEAHGAVFHLFEEVGFATATTEPKVFHATRGSFAICRCRPGYVEYVDPPLAEVMEGFAALRIRAMVDHGGTLRRKLRFSRVPRFTYWNVVAMHAGRVARPISI